MIAALQPDLFSPRSRTLPTALPDEEPYYNPLLIAHEDRLLAAGNDPLVFDTWDTVTFGAVGLDVEVFRNFFCVCVKRFVDGKRLSFERSKRADFDPKPLHDILKRNTIVTFNGSVYDLPILSLALAGASTDRLKEVSDELINGSIRPWDIEGVIGVPVLRPRHIDLMEPNPSVRMSLKMLAGRLHTKFVVDLPYDPAAKLAPFQMNVVTLYCQYGDLDATEKLYAALREPFQLRLTLGRRYGMDFLSRSDSQIGEAIVKRRVETFTGQRIEKPTPMTSGTFSYRRPDFLAFQDERLAALLTDLDSTVFAVTGGKIQSPPLLADLTVPLGAGVYSVGIGGLHSTEAHRALQSTDERVLIDVDVASQYPSIVRNLGLYPPALGPQFIDVYSQLIAERLAAKAAGDRTTADGIKISLNGVFGKLGSPYSVLYAPELLIAVTLTGQLAVLMLIEQAERAGIPVVSANTDGVVFHCPREREGVLREVLSAWEKNTGFVTEHTRYRALYSSSVNSYIAIREDGKVKIKGPLADPWSEGDLRGQLQKNPQMTICSQAVVAYLRDGVPLYETIEASDDPRAFVTLIRVSSGGHWRGHLLGKAVRYYWSLYGEPILTARGGRVPRTDGARPLMELPEYVPGDVDRLRYCEEASSMLIDLGVRPC